MITIKGMQFDDAHHACDHLGVCYEFAYRQAMKFNCSIEKVIESMLKIKAEENLRTYLKCMLPVMEPVNTLPI